MDKAFLLPLSYIQSADAPKAKISKDSNRPSFGNSGSRGGSSGFRGNSRGGFNNNSRGGFNNNSRGGFNNNSRGGSNNNSRGSFNRS